MGVIGHLIATAFRAFFRLIFTFVLGVLVGGGATLLVAYQGQPHWPPDQHTELAAGAIALLLGYGMALTVLTIEAVHALLATANLARKEAFSTGNIIEHGVKAVEHLQEKS